MKVIGLILLAIAAVILTLMLVLMFGTSRTRTQLERIFKDNIHS